MWLVPDLDGPIWPCDRGANLASIVNLHGFSLFGRIFLQLPDLKGFIFMKFSPPTPIVADSPHFRA